VPAFGRHPQTNPLKTPSKTRHGTWRTRHEAHDHTTLATARPLNRPAISPKPTHQKTPGPPAANRSPSSRLRTNVLLPASLCLIRMHRRRSRPITRHEENHPHPDISRPLTLYHHDHRSLIVDTTAPLNSRSRCRIPRPSARRPTTPIARPHSCAHLSISIARGQQGRNRSRIRLLPLALRDQLPSPMRRPRSA
jgi:hypothetical protein